MHTSIYTLGSPEHVDAILDAQADSGRHYDMSLNRTDFRTIVRALEHTSNTLGGSELAEDAWNFLSSISESLGVESV